MGRRQRHFNPVHAGAGLALDARYLTGYSNGANVTSWGSRPGTTFTLTGSSNFPTFSSSVAAAANQPGVSFLASSEQRLIRLGTPVVPLGSNTFTIVEFSTGGNGFIPFLQTRNATGIAMLFHPNGYNIVLHRGYFDWVGSSSQLINVSPYTNGVIVSGRQSGTTQEHRVGWNTLTSRTSSGTLGDIEGTIPINGQFRTGSLHGVSVFNSALSLPMLRRISDHYAFSFKTPL